jgi:hypothetical protein
MAENGATAARVVLLLVDGLGDVSVPSLGFRTPLQATPTPTLDALAAAGVCGLLDPVSPGHACGSDTAHLSLLGYDPRDCYRGRGAFESMGTGLDMAAGDVAFKCNFATLAPTLTTGAGAGVNDAAAAAALPRIVASRRADRHFEADGRALALALRCVCCVCGLCLHACTHALTRRSSFLAAQRCCARRWTACRSRRSPPALPPTCCPCAMPRSTAPASCCVALGCATESPEQVRARRRLLTRAALASKRTRWLSRCYCAHPHASCAADPLKDGLPLARSEALEDTPVARHTAAVVNQASACSLARVSFCTSTRAWRARVCRVASLSVCTLCAAARAQACDAIRAALRTHPVNVARAAAGRAVADALLLRGPGERLREAPFHTRHGCALARSVAHTCTRTHCACACLHHPQCCEPRVPPQVLTLRGFTRAACAARLWPPPRSSPAWRCAWAWTLCRAPRAQVTIAATSAQKRPPWRMQWRQEHRTRHVACMPCMYACVLRARLTCARRG